MLCILAANDPAVVLTESKIPPSADEVVDAFRTRSDGSHRSMRLSARTFAWKPRAAVRCVTAFDGSYGRCAKMRRGASSER